MAASARDLIGKLEREWRDALCAHDIDRLRELVHPDFVLIAMRSQGPFTMTRAEWLEAIEKRELVRIEIDITDAALFDQVMVGTIEAKWRVRYLGREIDECVLLTDVWVKDDGRWQVVRRHSSPMPCRIDGERSTGGNG